MKREAWIYFPLAIFFALMAVMYFFLGRYDGYKIEWVGVSAFTLSALMMAMIGAVFSLTGRKMDPRPEDRLDAEVYEGAGDVGFFPTQSIWPFWCALVAGLLFLAPVFGWWLGVLAVGLGIWALSGWLFQYYRGDYQH